MRHDSHLMFNQYIGFLPAIGLKAGARFLMQKKMHVGVVGQAGRLVAAPLSH